MQTSQSHIEPLVRAVEPGDHAAIDEVVRAKPASSKGRYIQKASISTTFGPGIPLDVALLA